MRFARTVTRTGLAKKGTLQTTAIFAPVDKSALEDQTDNCLAAQCHIVSMMGSFTFSTYPFKQKFFPHLEIAAWVFFPLRQFSLLFPLFLCVSQQP